ncbi:MAG: sulfite exporter TauE/SafE family protein [Candidatus Korobacteraceae bacterium]
MDLGAIAGRVAVGLVVGTLVGLTGLGGGMVLLPVLISVLGVPPIVAVGSDAVINCITKIGAGGLHWRQGNVSWPLVLSLAYGSIPGAIIGVALLAWIRTTYGNGVNDFLRVAIGILLVIIPIGYLFNVRSSAAPVSLSTLQENKYRFGVTLIGFFAGILVGLTSIGSGSVILMLLLVFYGFPPATMVGTDILHAVLLAGLTGFMQFKLGNVDFVLVLCVLAGSVPGGLLGAYLTNHVSASRLKQILCALLMAVGARMLWGSLLHAN